MNFIVQASLDPQGQLRGVVTHTQTGRKEQFADAVTLGNLIVAMLSPHLAGAKTAIEKLEDDAK